MLCPLIFWYTKKYLWDMKTRWKILKLKGEGTDKNPQAVYNWLKKAEKANNIYAREALDQYFWADGIIKEFWLFWRPFFVVEAYRLGRYDNVVGDGLSNAGKVEAYLWKAKKKKIPLRLLVWTVWGGYLILEERCFTRGRGGRYYVWGYDLQIKSRRGCWHDTVMRYNRICLAQFLANVFQQVAKR